ncbi:hypothetical protein AeNC1_017226, partial [Aphanomyces euteiches]
MSEDGRDMDPPEQPQQQVVERKKRFIFKDNHDELLLLEVLGDNGLFTHESSAKVASFTKSMSKRVVG